jgi:enediyne biosynthesis protein E4
MKTETNQGEAVIRRAFMRSIAAIVLGGLIVVGIYQYNRPAHETAPVPQADVATPVKEAQAPAAIPQVKFTDITQQAGIDFKQTNGAYGAKLLPETMGSGVGFIDYDNDGDQDMILVNATYWPDQPRTGQPTTRLYSNDGNGHFTDVSHASGLALDVYGHGLAIGDYDNDGWDDVYITALGKNHLLHNEHGHFVDVTPASGTAGVEQDWSITAMFFDYDNDGDLDLFVGNYVQWSPEINLEIDFRVTGLGRAYSTPKHYAGAQSRLYRNDGNGHFTDVTVAAGILPQGKALGVTAIDYDKDGLLDVFVSNDTIRNYLYHNKGNGTFEEIGMLEGIAFDRKGTATGAMGIDTAWYRNDEDLGVAIGNFANEMSSLYVTSKAKSPFADEAVLDGLGADSRLVLTFGLFFFDYDLDSRLDLLQANGHLENEINKVQPSQHFEQPAQLYWNCGDNCNNRLMLVKNTGDLSEPLVGRSAAYADIDMDGDLDVVITQAGRDARLFRNDQHTGHHWLRLKLVGDSDNHDAIGAVVELRAGGVSQRRLVMPSRSYMAQVELPVTFGLGASDHIDSLSVTWPNGHRQQLDIEQIDKLLTIRQTGS